MSRIALNEMGIQSAELLRRALSDGERVLLFEGEEDVAALISLDDLAFLEELEDRMDLEAAREAMKEPGTISWEEIKEKHGFRE
ncbi:MAG: type II toxin-antitoxin system Phd/YefM family antitoxin [bacterium]